MNARSIDTSVAIERTRSEYLDSILGYAFPVLDHGFTRIIDYMGDDHAIKAAAQTSYRDGNNKLTTGLGVLNYLMRHWHTSPFEMCELKVHQQMPLFVARQWIRHRTANVNEFSGRYSIMPDLFYIPEPERIQKQSQNNKQGSGEAFEKQEAEDIRRLLTLRSEQAFDDYKMLVERGLAKELARITLPQNIYTQWYWKIDLNNLFHLLMLRMDSHSQWEIQQYANVLWEHVQKWVPVSAEAFSVYRLHSETYSYRELSALNLLIDNDEAKIMMQQLHELDTQSLAEQTNGQFSPGEWREFLSKLDRLASKAIK